MATSVLVLGEAVSWPGQRDEPHGFVARHGTYPA
jgi:hypothetical protein